MGTGSANGQFVANLASPAQFDSIVFVASSYSTSEGSVKICGGDVIDLTNGGTDNKVLKRLVYVPTGIVDSISFETTAKRAYLKSIIFYPATDSTGGSDPVTPGAGITYELNGGVANTYGWTTPDEMFATFMAESGATDFSTLADYKAMTDPLAGTGICAKLNNPENCFADTAKWGWLMTYIMSVHAAQAAEGASALAAAGSGSAWRYAVGAFFIDGQRASWPKSANFATCGVSTYGAYSAVWQNAFANPTNPTGTFTLNEPYKANNTFDGWYAAADFSGAKVTTVDSTTTGTLYAKWIEYIPTLAEVKAMADNTNTKASGVVTYINGKNVYVQDPTGGLLLYMKANPTFNVGDKVVVSGQKVMYGGAPELKNGVEVSAVAASIPAATSFATLADACQEANMFTLVNVDNLDIVSLDSYNNPTVSDGTTTLLCYRMAVDTAVFKVGSHVDVTAVLGYYNGYQFVGDVAGIQLAQDTVPGEQLTSVTFNVIVPANTPDCYIAGSFNNWTHQQMTKLTDSTYTFTAGSVVLSTLEYKYCAGPDWAYVEVDADGYDVMNRSWQAQDRVAMWMAIPQDTVPTDDIMTLAEVKAMADSTNTKASGVVTYINGKNVYVQDPTGGLLLYMKANPTFNVGDKVVVSGQKVMYGGAPELKNGVEVSAVAASIPAATSFATLADACQEANMFTLVNVNNLEIVSLDSYNNPTVSDGTTTLLCYRMAVDTAVFKVGSHVDVTAVLGYFNGYQFVGDAAGIQLAQDTVPGEQPTSVTFNVIVPANTPDCYIAGSFNNWTHQQMTQLTANTYTYTANNIDMATLAYKYCAGNGWAYVEKDANGNDVMDRTWHEYDTVAAWANTNLVHDGLYYEITSMNTVSVIPDPTGGNYLNLTNVVIPDTVVFNYTTYQVTGIASQAFYDCTSMTTLEVGENIEQVGMAAFFGCSNLTSVVWSAKNCSEISDGNSVYAFFSATSLTDFRFGTSVETIPSGLCGFMDQLTTITIPTGVKAINRYAFYGCSSLATVNLPGTLESIGYGAFLECESLTKTNFTGNLKQWCEIFIESEGSPVMYSQNLYINDVLLTHADIPEGTTAVNSFSFTNDTCLISATVPNSVTFIGTHSFNGCTNIETIEVGNGVTDLASIDNWNSAFSNCQKLKKFVYNSTMADDLSVDFWFTSPEIDTLVVPANMINNAPSYYPDHIRYIEVIDGEISSGGFSLFKANGSSLGSLLLAGASNTTLEDKAFYELYKLTNLSLPQNLQTIPYKMAADCYMLENIVIPSSVTTIGNNAFENCRSLDSVDFGTTTALQQIGNWAFYNCHNLPTLTIPEGVTYVGDGAFYGCSYLTELTLPSTMLTMGDNSFALCSRLQKMNVSAAIPPTIASKTFKDVLRSIPVYVPKASVSLYKTDEYWREFNIIGGEEEESAVDNISSEGTTKIYRDGQVLIYHNGKCYDMMGNLVE